MCREGDGEMGSVRAVRMGAPVEVGEPVSLHSLWGSGAGRRGRPKVHFARRVARV